MNALILDYVQCTLYIPFDPTIVKEQKAEEENKNKRNANEWRVNESVFIRLAKY